MDDKRDVTAKLVDVAPPSADWPDGYELNITDTILRLRYREGWDREVFMEPGIPYRISIGATTHETPDLYVRFHSTWLFCTIRAH